MADEKVQLLGTWGSPFSRRIELALKLKGVDYEYIEEDVYIKKSDLLLKYNPIHKKVPVLVHGGKSISESIVILEYIEETWKLGRPILPSDPYERALARFWAKFVDDKCLPALMKASRSEGQEQGKAIGEGMEALKTLEKELKNKRFFGGDSIGFVDIVANFLAYWFPAMEEALGLENNLITTDKFPNLSKWSEEFVANGVVMETLPPKEKLVHALRALFSTPFVSN